MLSTILILLGVALAAFFIYENFIKEEDLDFSEDEDDKPKKPTLHVDAKTMKYGPINIYYCSQSGTSEGFAETLREEAAENSILANCISVKDFDEETHLTEEAAIFLISTHYEGEPPDDANEWWDWMKSAVDLKKASQLKYAVFGLGDRTYKFFNKMGKDTDEFLEKMGAQRIFATGLGSNDLNSIEDDFEEWKIGIWNAFAGKVPANPEYDATATASAKTTKFVVKEAPAGSSETDYSSVNTENFDLNAGNLMSGINGRVKKVREMRQKPTDMESTLEFEIEVPSDFTYTTACNLNFFPENPEETVRKALDCVGKKEGDMLEVKLGSGKKLPCPPVTTAGNLFRRFVDLQGKLRKSSIKTLAKIVKDEGTRAELEKLLDRKDAAALKALHDKNTGIIDLITNYNIKLSVAEFLEIATRITPRLYTVASSGIASSRRICVVASMEYMKVGEDKMKGGLASLQFQRIQKDFKAGKPCFMRFTIQDSTFFLPKKPNTPCIFVGAGTGYAPFRGFTQERNHFVEKKLEGGLFGKCNLFFGCRHREGDYIYREEIQDYQANGVYSVVLEAFSRDDPKMRVYVQDLFVHKRDLFKRVMFEEGGNFYICGSNAMANAMKDAMKKHIADIKSVTDEEAAREFELLVKDQRICIEAWA